MIMEEKEGQKKQRERSQSVEERQKPEIEESPAEKLEATPPTGSLIPGPENPDSEEIKEEKKPNTE
jgi:hypothetical protein